MHLQDKRKNGATKDSCPGLASPTAENKQNLRDLAQWDETQRGGASRSYRPTRVAPKR